MFFGVLPTFSTLRKHAFAGIKPLLEPGFSMERFAAILRFFEILGYRGKVFIGCNDATAVRAAVTWRPQDNALIGLGTTEDVRCGSTMQDILSLVQNFGVATQANTHFVSTLDPMLPTLVSGIFPQNGRVDADAIAMRWAIEDDCLEQLGAVMIAHCTDGDSSQLSAMRRRQYEVEMAAATHQSENTSKASSVLADTDGDDDDDDSNDCNHHSSGSLGTSSKAARSIKLRPTYHLRPRDCLLSFSVPQLIGTDTVRVSASAVRIPFEYDGQTHLRLIPSLHFQDAAHIATKVRMQLLGRNGQGLRIGDGLAHVRIFHKAFSGDYQTPEVHLGLRQDDLDPKRDPMDVPACLRLMSDDVLEYLRLLDLSIPAAPLVPPQQTSASVDHGQLLSRARSVPTTSRHLRAVLQMAQRAVHAFMDPKLSPLQRIYCAWYARYFAEGWRLDCKAECDTKVHFLSANQYACIILNAESLLLLLLWFLSAPEFKVLPFAVQLCGSQPGEYYFRLIRLFSHDRNFTVEQLMWRNAYAELEALIRSRRSDDFIFRAHRKHTHMDRIHYPAVALPTIHELQISAELQRARDDAHRDLLSLGVRLPQPKEAPPLASFSSVAAEALRHPQPEDEQLDDVDAQECELVGCDDLPQHALHHLDDCNWDLFADTAAGDTPEIPQPDLPTLPLVDPLMRSCFASRPSQIVPVHGVSRTVKDNLGRDVDKRTACAIVCMHPSISADRQKRVQKMNQKMAGPNLDQYCM